MNNENNENNENNKDFVIINSGRGGMSYNELKELHNTVCP